MVQLNLLPDVKKEFLHAESVRRKTIAFSILISIIAAGLTVAFAFYVYAVQNVILSVQTSDIKNKSSQLNNVKDIDKYLVVQNQLASLSSLHNEKNNYSRLLDFLPRLNPAPPQNITLATLDVSSEDHTITFKGKVADYGSLTTFKDTLSNAEFTYQTDGEQQSATKLFTDVVITSATYQNTGNQTGVTFSVMATYNEEVFKQKNIDVNVTIPNKETTGSVVNSPQAIFGGESDGSQ